MANINGGLNIDENEQANIPLEILDYVYLGAFEVIRELNLEPRGLRYLTVAQVAAIDGVGEVYHDLCVDYDRHRIPPRPLFNRLVLRHYHQICNQLNRLRNRAVRELQGPFPVAQDPASPA